MITEEELQKKMDELGIDVDDLDKLTDALTPLINFAKKYNKE